MANMGIFNKPLKLIRIVGFLIGLLSLYGWLIGLFFKGLRFLGKWQWKIYIEEHTA